MATINEPEAPGSVSTGACPQCGCVVEVAHAHGSAAAAPGGTADAALLRQAREQIQSLESQVTLLDQKAAAAIDRWADYEDELAQLRRQLAAATRQQGGGGACDVPSIPAGAPPPTPASPTRTSFLATGAANRLSALLSPRAAKSTPDLKAAASSSGPLPPLPPTTTAIGPTVMPTPPPSATAPGHGSGGPSFSSVSGTTSPVPPRTPYGSFSFFGGNSGNNSGRASAASPPPPPPPAKDNNAAAVAPSTKDLLEALTREQKLRRAAEGRLQDTSREVEELSVSLFEQANEMVAEERRARARLEARVAVLEQRDSDKKHRLERLEQAMDRIERVRAMLGQSVVAASATADAATTATIAATASAAVTRTQYSTPNRHRFPVSTNV